MNFKQFFFAFTLLSCSYCLAQPYDNAPIEEILNYWFGKLQSAEDYPSDKESIWFNGGEKVDAGNPPTL